MALDRRTFIKNSSLLVSTSLLPYQSLFASSSKKQLGVCLVGLGYYSTDLLAPALQLTKHCKLSGIVTGSPNKIPIWQKRYRIVDKNVYNYQNMHRIADNPDIDVIYIVLPTGMHAEYAIKAANTGKHVWCEKPMARTTKECQSIIKACKDNNVKLSIGYRMQHEPNTQQIIQWGISKPYGNIKTIKAEAGYYDSRSNHWKQKKTMGGGAMYDMGVYPLNATRYATNEEPITVLKANHTTTRPKVYTEVDETTTFSLEFPSGAIANCKTSFGEGLNQLHITCEKGWYKLQPFQSYGGIHGTTSDRSTLLNQYIPNQQAAQMDNDALSIINNTTVLVPGEEGMKDIKIVEAIYKSAKTNNAVSLI
ncbi:Gfo/Idh/MocA family protein [Aquimarina sp. 2201CG14-23]|uniref:Gfo/Idh/MocA family protein n=1 Tax=Aquimarina mycalae TaxID=3040073 RepID=UPI002478199C|nr:Gfo/Idh/MocA family oxidoreductase [Aquimarina sp. 2201CG14-23]MDH7447531.1 Gfo/Idh/MocA family oxidoreductase [Aquimarina sp. 2201CG14-23]